MTNLIQKPGIHHLQTQLQRGGKTILVDAGLAFFLEELWTQGYVTHASCQGVEGGFYAQSLPYIMFDTAEQAKSFAKVYGGDVEIEGYVQGHAVVRGFLVEV